MLFDMIRVVLYMAIFCAFLFGTFRLCDWISKVDERRWHVKGSNEEVSEDE